MDDRNGEGGTWRTESNHVIVCICVSGPWTVALVSSTISPTRPNISYAYAYRKKCLELNKTSQRAIRLFPYYF